MIMKGLGVRGVKDKREGDFVMKLKVQVYLILILKFAFPHYFLKSTNEE